jgi:hypothetical protein
MNAHPEPRRSCRGARVAGVLGRDSGEVFDSFGHFEANDQ